MQGSKAITKGVLRLQKIAMVPTVPSNGHFLPRAKETVQKARDASSNLNIVARGDDHLA